MSFRWERWTLANILPIFFVFLIAGSIWGVYVLVHLRDLLQLDAVSGEFDEDAYRRGHWQLCVSQVLTLMFLINFGLAIFVDPGSVPDEPNWVMEDEKGGRISSGFSRRKASSQTTPIAPISHESKKTGLRRFCKWCARYKPDRCHHCRVCASCILRMDHHCPWIANCVGYRNHKFFLLLVMYSCLSCHFIWMTQLESVANALAEECPHPRRVALVFGQTLCVMMALLVTVFLCFHLWLTSRATTTIEFCEKQRSGKGPSQDATSTNSIYDRGCFENFKAVLGPRVWLWWAPFDAPSGGGLHFLIVPPPLLSSSRFSKPSLRPPPSAPATEEFESGSQPVRDSLYECASPQEKLQVASPDLDTFSVSSEENLEEEAQPEVEPGIVASIAGSSSADVRIPASHDTLRRARCADAPSEPEWTGPKLSS